MIIVIYYKNTTYIWNRLSDFFYQIRKISLLKKKLIERINIITHLDPSEWNSNHIASWISWCSQVFSIKPPPSTTKFPSTGKELLKLSSDYWQAIPGGKILARHLGYLQFQATGVQTPDLLQEEKIDGK